MKKKLPPTFDTSKIRNYFATGIVILLPVALTLLIVSFFFNLLTRPFEGMMTALIASLGIFEGGAFFLSEAQLVLWTSKILIIFFIVGVTILLGYLARWVLIHWLIRLGEAIVHRIPFIRAVYKTSQDVIKTIFTTQTKSFKQPVLVPYPNADTFSLGLITREELTDLNHAKIENPVAVFIPTTPNPTSGFLLIFPKKDVTYLDMSIEEALKYIISCGVITTPLKPKLPKEADKT